MLSSFSRLLPANVNVSIPTPDFFKFGGQQPQQPQPVIITTAASSTSGIGTNGGGGEHEGIGRPLSKTTREESQTSINVENESGAARKKRKDTSATETFIIVRPPPSKTNHPLNLQVQLVAASGRERSKRSGSTSTTASGRGGEGIEIPKQSNASRETLEDPNQRSGVSLRRTASIQSNRSDTESTFSSSSTYSTNASGSSSNRRMIPLYNLHAHNVMTNVITDAGTDAKIAKFFKRGLEIMGLVILEPVEVWGVYTWNDREDTLGNGLGGVTIIGKGPDGLGLQVSRTLSNLQRSINPIIPAPSGDGSRISTHSNNMQPPDLPTVLEIPSSPSTPKPVEKETKKLSFGNFFKKKKEPPVPLALGKESNISAPLASAKSATFSLAPPTAGLETPVSSKRKSMTPSVVVSSPLANQMSTPTMASFPMSGNGPDVMLQPQILGLQAVLQSPTVPPRGRPSTYVWVVRKWIKGSPEGLLGAVMDGFKEATNVMTNLTAGGGSGFAASNSTSGNNNNNTAPAAAAGGMEVEVRFEWKRSSKTKMGPPGAKDRRRGNVTGSTIGEDGERSRRQSTSERPTSVSPRFSVNLDVEQSASPKSKRLSLQSPPIGGGKKPHALEKDNLSTEHLNPAKYSRASSPNPPPSVTTQGTTEENLKADDGDDSDSDPEDSERPWNCYLHIRAVEGRGSAGGSITTSRTQSRDELDSHDSHEGKEKALDIKLRIACLAPAPHHPKVVAQVKAPYPLPDVIFNSAYGARLKDRVDGSKVNLDDEDEDEKDKALKLTAEEIKDVISCTGLWLIVREGYGGLSKKRKGDGWRLRG